VRKYLVLFLLTCTSCATVEPEFTQDIVRPGVLEQYDRILSRAPQFFERGWTEGYQRDPTLGYFAEGKHDELSMRTLGNFITTYAFLSRHPGYDEKVGGISQKEMQRKAIMAIRYMIRTNTTGDLNCVSGFKWGDDPLGRGGWESSWYASKMATGAVMIWDRLTDEDKEGIRRVLGSECDRSARFPAPTGTSNDTKSEENAWDCESLAWALVLFPDDVRAATWEQTLYSYAINTLSVEGDKDLAVPMGDKMVSDWYRGPNVHDEFTIENHGFYHICYMSCPLHSLTWSAYAYLQAGQTPPECLLHHFTDVWNVLRRFHLWDGRFAYAGGKDWPRYVYGLNFMMPALVFAHRTFLDDYAHEIETKRLELLKWEQGYNDDGAFFSKRFTNLDMFGRHVEFDSDVYADLVLAYRLHQLKWPEDFLRATQFDKPEEGIVSTGTNMASLRGDRRYASWSWAPRVKPAQGIFAIRGMESALEWDGNLFGVTRVEGRAADTKSEWWTLKASDGELITTGFLQLGLRPTKFQLGEDVSGGFVPVLPDHRLLNHPHKIGQVDRMTSDDTILELPKQWTVVAKASDGLPCLVTRKAGEGEIVVCMSNAGKAYLGDSSPCLLFENLTRYFKGDRVGYLPGEVSAEAALEKAGIQFETLESPDRKTDLSQYDWVITGRNSWQRVGDKKFFDRMKSFVKAGGGVVCLVLQDRGFDARQLEFDDDGEGEGLPYAVQHNLAYVALPDDRTCLKYDFLVASADAKVQRSGLRWLIGNDIFNGNKRVINGMEIQGVGGAPRSLTLDTKEINIDDKLFMTVLVGDGPILLRDNAERNVVWGSLLTEGIYYPYWSEYKAFKKGDVIQRTVIALDGRLPGESPVRYEPEEGLDNVKPGVFAGRVYSPTGKVYRVVANLTREALKTGDVDMKGFDVMIKIDPLSVFP